MTTLSLNTEIIFGFVDSFSQKDAFISAGAHFLKVFEVTSLQTDMKSSRKATCVIMLPLECFDFLNRTVYNFLFVAT